MTRQLIVPFAGIVLLAASTAMAEDYTQPTEHHKEMARDAGVWDADVTMWMEPDAEPMKSKAVETNKMVGDMWLLSEFEGEFGGQKFSGRGAFGYDPIKKKYIGGWIDSMSPFMQKMSGEYDVDTHTLTMMGETVDVRTGKPITTKMVTRYKSHDEKVFEMHMPVEGEDGEYYKSMEIKYTRRK